MASYPVIRIPGLPDINEESQDVWTFSELTNWSNGSAPRAVLVPNGDGPGATPSGQWYPPELYLTLVGRVLAAPEAQESIRAALLTALPMDRAVRLAYLGRGWDVDKQVWVRRYDQPTITKSHSALRFSIPLVAPDPLKYALTEVSGQVGVFAGATWVETFSKVDGVWVETFSKVDGVWVETFTRSTEEMLAYPTSLTLTSEGTVASRRMEATVHGPLTAGDWYLLHEQTGQRSWLQATIPAGESATIDFRDWSATLLGADVSHLLFGKPLQLPPGPSTFRLISNTPSGTAYATIAGLPAYE